MERKIEKQNGVPNFSENRNGWHDQADTTPQVTIKRKNRLSLIPFVPIVIVFFWAVRCFLQSVLVPDLLNKTYVNFQIICCFIDFAYSLGHPKPSQWRQY